MFEHNFTPSASDLLFANTRARFQPLWGGLFARKQLKIHLRIIHSTSVMQGGLQRNLELRTSGIKLGIKDDPIMVSTNRPQFTLSAADRFNKVRR